MLWGGPALHSFIHPSINTNHVVVDTQVGDRVALEPGVACRSCRLCAHGKYNLCPEMKFFATPPVHGALARYVNHPAALCFKVPDAVSMEEAAMVEPLR